MSRWDKSRSLEWGSAHRPKVSNKLGIPFPNEGSDGDIQVRQTSLGGKLFAKLGGRWHDAPLSLSTGSSAYTVDEINLTGKITITSAGTDNVVIGTGNTDVGEKNVVIGVNAGAAMTGSVTDSIFIGDEAGDVVTSGTKNICLGSACAPHMTTGISNNCIGFSSGEVIESGNFNVYIGFRSAASATNVTNEVVICGGNSPSQTVGKGSNTVVLGASNATDIYLGQNSQSTVHCQVLTLKETSTPTALSNYGKIYCTSDNELFFQDGDGTEHQISFE